jgi:hypothetical protein
LPDASGGAECDDAICASSIGGKTTDFSEGCRIGDDVIGGERDNYRITVALGGKCRASGNSRPGIASYRLEQDVGLNADFGQLLGDQKTILRVGYDDRAAEQARVRNPVQGILKGRTRTEQWQELFGAAFARCRPQPRAGAAAHDQGDNRWCQVRCSQVGACALRLLRWFTSCARPVPRPRRASLQACDRAPAAP